MCIDAVEDPTARQEGGAGLGASLVQQAEKFKLFPGGKRELTGVGSVEEERLL